MAGGVDGPALGAVLAGSVFLYAAFTGKSVLKSVQAVVSGKSPATVPAPAAVTGPTAADNTGSAAGVISGAAIPSGSGQAALQAAAAAHGWGSGTQWQALQAVEMQEAGFNPEARNPQSGALGIAQALGHGDASTAGTLGNEYGGFGLSDAQAQAANSGDAGAQSVWMVNYIAATYGNPVNAWAHEQSAGWY